MKAATILLALFVILTIVFASISVFEYFNPTAQPLQLLTTVTTIITTQPSTSQTQTSGSNPFKDNGYITIGSIGNFIYARIPILTSGEPTASTTLQNVTFTYLKPNATTTGAICYTFKTTFQDGSSETLTACSYPTGFATDVVFSNHTTNHNTHCRFDTRTFRWSIHIRISQHLKDFVPITSNQSQREDSIQQLFIASRTCRHYV